MALDTDHLVDAIKLAGSVVGTMVAGVLGYPLVRNHFSKGKQVGIGIGHETRQMESTDDRMERLEAKLNVMDEKLSAHAIKMTRLQMLVVKLEGLMDKAGVDIPQNVKDEMVELLKDVR